MQRLFVIARNLKMRLVQEVQLLLVVEGLSTFEDFVVELRELKKLVDRSAELVVELEEIVELVELVDLVELVELASALITMFVLFTPVVYAPCTSPRYCESEPSPAIY